MEPGCRLRSRVRKWSSLAARLFPTHFVGVQAEGNIPSGGLGLGYNVGIGNGRSSLLSKSGDSGDSNDNRAWVANVYARPSRFYGLQVGASVYRDKLTPQPGQNFGEWITAADVVWTKENPEFLSEYANVHHRDELTGQYLGQPGFLRSAGVPAAVAAEQMEALLSVRVYS